MWMWPCWKCQGRSPSRSLWALDRRLPFANSWAPTSTLIVRVICAMWGSSKLCSHRNWCICCINRICKLSPPTLFKGLLLLATSHWYQSRTRPVKVLTMQANLMKLNGFLSSEVSSLSKAVISNSLISFSWGTKWRNKGYVGKISSFNR